MLMRQFIPLGGASGNFNDQILTPN